MFNFLKNKDDKFAIFKLKSNSVRIAIVAFALFLLLNALSSFGVIPISGVGDLLLSFTAAIIMIMEVGLVRIFGGVSNGKRGMDLLNAFGIISAILVLVITSLGAMDITFAILDAIKGYVFAIMFVSFTIEAFIR